MVRGEYYLSHIIITRICGGSHSSVCYYLSQPAKTGCFHNTAHYIPNIVWFTFENTNLSFVDVLFATELFGADMKHYITS